MKVGILGSGDVAKTLSSGFLKHDHTVMLGTRDIGKLADWQAQNPRGQVGSTADAADFGELLILAVKGSAAAGVLRAAGAALDGKVVIDTTNPITDTPPYNGVLNFFTDFNEALMEKLQKEFPAARLVKAFSSVGAARMVNPPFDSKPTMFIAGNDLGAKTSVTAVLDQFGWEAEDMGGAEAARAIEPLCILWCIPGFKDNRWTHAFKLLK